MRRGPDAPPLLFEAAKRLEPLDAALARETYLDALWAAIIVGRMADGGGVLEVVEAAMAVPPAPGPPRAADLLRDGLAVLITEGLGAAAPTLKRAVSAFRRDDISREERLRRVWLASHVARLVWDDESWVALCTDHLQMARDAGALSLLHVALNQRMGVQGLTGELAAAASLFDEAEAVGEATGSRLAPYGALALAAWRGREAELLAPGRGPDARAGRAGRGSGPGRHPVGERAALQRPRPLRGSTRSRRSRTAHHELLFSAWALVELIEAAVRSGEPELAADALRRLSETTRAAGTDWALGIEARSRALLSDDEAPAERLYREAIERLARTRIRPELARTHLLYGEWLRRQKRRLDAREQLRTAHQMLAAMGMDAFAQRAARELGASGETARKRSGQSLDHLTAREAQIARLARDGLSNPEIGARLFISPRTVEYHLHKVYGKLDITSRNELAGDAGAALTI